MTYYLESNYYLVSGTYVCGTYGMAQFSVILHITYMCMLYVIVSISQYFRSLWAFVVNACWGNNTCIVASWIQWSHCRELWHAYIYIMYTDIIPPSGQLLDVRASQGSVLVEFDIAASDLPYAPSQSSVVHQLMLNVQSGDVSIPYPILLQVDKVRMLLCSCCINLLLCVHMHTTCRSDISQRRPNIA